MNVPAQYDPIVGLVCQILGEIAGTALDAAQLKKSVLVRDGQYCGRAFRFRDLRAVWFAEANELKFYRDQGPLLRAIRLDGASQLSRAA